MDEEDSLAVRLATIHHYLAALKQAENKQAERDQRPCWALNDVPTRRIAPFAHTRIPL
jgi:hypothetical protein